MGNQVIVVGRGLYSTSLVDMECYLGSHTFLPQPQSASIENHILYPVCSLVWPGPGAAMFSGDFGIQDRIKAEVKV